MIGSDDGRLQGQPSFYGNSDNVAKMTVTMTERTTSNTPEMTVERAVVVTKVMTIPLSDDQVI